MYTNAEQEIAKAAGGAGAGEAWLPRESFAPANAFIAPVTETERRLLALWARVLQIDGLGVEDDFFEFGGDSFSATALFLEIERSFGQAPPLSAVLDCPTVRLLAARLDGSRAAGAEAAAHPLVVIRQEGSRPPLFFMHAADGNVLFVVKLAGLLNRDQPLYAIQARGFESGETPHRCFASMAADYAAAIRRAQSKGPYRLAGYCIGSIIAMEVAQQLRTSGETVEIVLMIDPDIHPEVAPWLYWRHPHSALVRAWRPVVRAGWAVRRMISRAIMPPKRHPLPRLTADDLRRQQAIRVGILAALKFYRPRPYDGRLLILCSAKSRARLGNEARGWPAVAPRTEMIAIALDHDDVMHDSLPILCREIQSQLDRIGTQNDALAAA